MAKKAAKKAEPSKKAEKKPAKEKSAKPAKAAKAPKEEKSPKLTSAESVAEKPKKEPKAPKPPRIKKETAAKLAEASEDLRRWNEFKEKFGKDKAPSYAMSSSFTAQSPLQHKVLGWGYIVSNNNDRLEVLFESGKKVLISNYQVKE